MNLKEFFIIAKIYIFSQKYKFFANYFQKFYKCVFGTFGMLAGWV